MASLYAASVQNVSSLMVWHVSHIVSDGSSISCLPQRSVKGRSPKHEETDYENHSADACGDRNTCHYSVEVRYCVKRWRSYEKPEEWWVWSWMLLPLGIPTICSCDSTLWQASEVSETNRLGGVTLVFSIVIDSLSAFVEMPEWLWRILFFRYTLLIWLGYDVLANGIRISPKLLLLAMISIAFILKMYYGNSDLSPWLIHNGWKVEHWPAYFYPAYLLLWIIRSLYEITPSMIRRLVSRFGMASYEIFLLQMFFFSIFKPAHVDLFQNEVFNFLLFLMIAWSFSLGGGLYWNTLKEKKLIK